MKRVLSALIATAFLLTSCSADLPPSDVDISAEASPSVSATASEKDPTTKSAEKKAEKKKAKKKAEKKDNKEKAEKEAPKKPAKKKANKKPAATGNAATTLKTLPVKGRAPKTGYSRDLFGTAWKDVDRNGCDTRNDMLNRDLTNRTHGDAKLCKVMTGVLADPYTGKSINFTRGVKTSSAVQIDHVVALSDAWQKGAQQISADQKLKFANDPLNLLASDGPANMQKGDGDTATWLPKHKPSRCPYVARQIAVKAKYKLWVTAAEKDAMTRVLTTCPSQGLPKASDGIATKTTGNASKPPAKPLKPKKKSPKKSSSSSGKADPRFSTCKEAKSSGYGNYTKGKDVEYDWYRDGDKDGVVCE